MGSCGEICALTKGATLSLGVIVADLCGKSLWGNGLSRDKAEAEADDICLAFQLFAESPLALTSELHFISIHITV